MLKIIKLFLVIALFFSTVVKLSAGEVYFDTSHKVVFHPQSSEPLGLKGFLTLFEKKGGTVSIGDLDFTQSGFGGIQTLVLPGSMIPFKKTEVDLIESYVRDGGNLVILLHISSPFARLTERFGIIVSNMVISEKQNLIDGKSQNFFAKEIRDHEITKGINEIALYGTWGLLAEKGATIVISTTEHTWADGNRNRVYDAGEPLVGKVGVVAVAQPGKGKVVVIADDAPMANAFLGVGDNLRLANNIVDWMTEKDRTAFFRTEMYQQ